MWLRYMAQNCYIIKTLKHQDDTKNLTDLSLGDFRFNRQNLLEQEYVMLGVGTMPVEKQQGRGEREGAGMTGDRLVNRICYFGRCQIEEGRDMHHALIASRVQLCLLFPT